MIRTYYSKSSHPTYSFGVPQQIVTGKFLNDTTLEDITGNGNIIYICYKDWEGTSGIPHKTAAFFHMPISRYGLINDSTHFWFNTSNHTANFIPVSSFFQDVDYNHSIFTKHKARVIDDNGIEHIESGLQEIVTFSHELTGSNLISAQTYFDVPPEEITNVYWVDPVNGSNTNPGTKLNPWKTLSKAETSGIAGRTVYCKTGTIRETYTVYMRAMAYKGIGNCVVTVENPSVAIVRTGGTGITFSGFVFEGVNVTTAIFYIYSSSSNTTVENCRFNNTAMGTRTFSFNGSFSNIVIRGNVFVQANNQDIIYSAGSNVSFCDNFFKGTLSGVKRIIYNLAGGEVTNNKFLNCTATDIVNTSQTSGQSITISGNKFIRSIQTPSDIFLNLSNADSPVMISYNTFIASGNSCNIKTTGGNGNLGAILNIQHNRITHTPTAIANSSRIFVNNHSRVVISDNNISVINESGASIAVFSSGNQMSEIVVENNILNCDFGYGILIGSDASGPGDFQIAGAVVSGNKVTGSRSNDIWTTDHAILIGYTTGTLCKYNYITHAGIGIGIKGKNNEVENGTTMYNLITDCSQGIILSGARNQGVFNNTIIASQTSSGHYGVRFKTNISTSYFPATGNTVMNNLVYVTQTNGNAFCVVIDDDDCSENVLDYNNFFNPNLATSFRVSSVTKTFGQWQSLGFDVNGIFKNYPLTDYVPDKPILTGEILDEYYEPGLDPSTTFGSDPVLHSQGIEWQVGCYVQDVTNFPTLTEAFTDTSGKYISLEFDQGISQATTSTFVIKAGGEILQQESITVNRSRIIIGLIEEINPNEIVVVEHDNAEYPVFSVWGFLLQSISGFPVTNYVL